MDDRQQRLDAAQWQGVNAWRLAMALGTLMWHTGVGKTHAVVKAYPPFRQKFPNPYTDNIIVVVPTTNLKEAWENHAVKWGWTGVEVFVINSYVTELHKCKWLIVDEIHRVLGLDADVFNKTLDVTTYDFCLGLSATLTAQEETILQRRGIPIVHRITEMEARNQGFTSDYIEFNMAVKLNHIEEKDYRHFSEMHNKNQRFFVIEDQFDFHTAMACMNNMDKCRAVARYRGWHSDQGENDDNSPSSIKKAAVLWNKGMTERKNILYACKDKIDKAVAIINNYPGKKIITFSQTADSADAITFRIGKKARSYHTKLKGEVREQVDLFGKPIKTKKVGVKKVKEETLELFAKGEIDVLNTVKALDEGYDLPQIDMSIILAGTSKNRQQKQRKGRSTRYDKENVDKKSIIINLYIKATQDEKWLKERQENSRNVHWVTDIEEIDEIIRIENEDFSVTG